MKKVLLSSALGVFIATTPGFAQTPPPAPVAVEAVPAHHHEHHPELRHALKDLNLAKDHLEKAAHDYGGHRVRALEAINHAIDEVHAAIEYANNH